MSTTLKGQPAVRTNRPDAQTVEAFLQANAIFGETVRFQQLDRREAFLRCQQYAHQKIDWNGRSADQLESISSEAVFPPGFTPSTAGADDALARDKRPTAPTNKAKVINRRYTGLLFSEGRKPEVKVAGDPDTEAFLEAVREAAAFWPAMRSARKLGGGLGSVAMTVHLRDGEFSYEVHNTKNCTPVWRDPRKRVPSGMLIMWRYKRLENTYDDKTKKFAGVKEVDWLYRRIITETADVVYRDIKLEDAGSDKDTWEELMRVDHGLGFFPGVWIQNTAESVDMDGEPDCDGAYQTIDTNDRLLAQANYGALNNLDPTMVLAYDTKQVAAMGGGGGVVRKGSDNSLHLGEGGSGNYMEMTGSGIEAAMKLSDRLERNICDMTGAVFLDDKDMGAMQSAKAIEFRFAPMLEVADDLRAQYGAAVIMLMRITEKMTRAFLGIRVELPPDEEGPRVGTFSIEDFVLPPRQVRDPATGATVTVSHSLGEGGYMSLKWGKYFSPTLDDNRQTIANAAAANAAGFIKKETGAAEVAQLYGIDDVQGEVQAARDEGVEDADRALSAAMGGTRPVRALAEHTATGQEVFGRPTGEGASA